MIELIEEKTYETKILDELTEFEDFLDKNLETIFMRTSPFSCPIACYLRQKTNKEVAVGATTYSIGYDSFVLPELAALFVRVFDMDKTTLSSIKTGREAKKDLERARKLYSRGVAITPSSLKTWETPEALQ